MPLDQTPVVYFIATRDRSSVKIGKSSLRNVRKRVKHLGVGSAEALDLIGMVQGSFELESFIQKSFVHLHVNGEWYRLTDEIKSVIEKQDQTLFLKTLQEGKPNGKPPGRKRRGESKNDGFLSNFINNMRRQRKKKRLSQQEVADKAGLSAQYVSLLERGQRNNLTLKAALDIAVALEVPLANIFEEPHEL